MSRSSRALVPLAKGDRSGRRDGLVRSAALAALALALGCDVYDASLVDRPDAGPPEGCEPRRVPPPRPAAPDDGVEAGPFGYAVKDVVFEQDGDRWRTIGYDLDGRCTARPAFDAECVPTAPGASPEIDGVGGTDNAFGHQLYPLVQVTVPGLQEASRAFQARGNGSILVTIAGWNGEPNDSRVEVRAAVTVFATGPAVDGGAPDARLGADGMPVLGDGSPAPAPAWDGRDYFWARSDNYLDDDPARPLIRDDNAYVSGDVLVFALPERTDFIFPGDDVGLMARLTGALVAGRVARDKSSWDDVVVAGRWALNDLLMTAESVGVCEGTPQYDIFENQLARIVDVRSRAGTGGEGVPCDAISVGIGFQGWPARFGGLAEGPPVTDACAMMRLDAGADASAPPDGGL